MLREDNTLLVSTAGGMETGLRKELSCSHTPEKLCLRNLGDTCGLAKVHPCIRASAITGFNRSHTTASSST